MKQCNGLMQKMFFGILFSFMMFVSSSSFAYKHCLFNLKAGIAESDAGKEFAKEMERDFVPQKEALEKEAKEMEEEKKKLNTKVQANKKWMESKEGKEQIGKFNEKSQLFGMKVQEYQMQVRQKEGPASAELARELEPHIASVAQKKDCDAVFDSAMPGLLYIKGGGDDILKDVLKQFNEAYNKEKNQKAKESKK